MSQYSTLNQSLNHVTVTRIPASLTITPMPVILTAAVASGCVYIPATSHGAHVFLKSNTVPDNRVYYPFPRVASPRPPQAEAVDLSINDYTISAEELGDWEEELIVREASIQQRENRMNDLERRRRGDAAHPIRVRRNKAVKVKADTTVPARAKSPVAATAVADTTDDGFVVG